MIKEITLFVPGHARTSGSKSGFINPVTGKLVIAPAGKYQKAWQDRVEYAVIQSKYHRMILWTGPIKMELEFTYHRLKGHYRTVKGKLTGEIKASKLNEPKTTRPDLDKLVRAVCDPLTMRVYHDDSQIVLLVASKRFCNPQEPEGVYITIEQLKE